VRLRERERVRRPVGRSDQCKAVRRERAEQREQVTRLCGGKVGVDDEDRAGVDLSERGFDRRALASAPVRNDHLGGNGVAGDEDVLEHRVRKRGPNVLGRRSEAAFSALPAEGNNHGRHAVERLSRSERAAAGQRRDRAPA